MSQGQPKSEYDTPWKIIIDTYFEDFMAYCWPQKYIEIDWTKGYELLDKELSKIIKGSVTGNKILDKLIKVYRKDGQSAYVLLHLEVQRGADLHFEERMYTYRHRLWDLYRKPIASLAILIDKNKKWRPGIFREELWDSSVEMRFPIIKLIDYKQRQEELEASSNPFAQVIVAQLAAMEKQDPKSKFDSKFALIKKLYQQKWQKDDIMNLIKFIDWIIALPEELDLQFQEAVYALEEETKVEYITSFERIATQRGVQQGIQQGVQQGIQQGESTLLISLLKHKFKTIPRNYRQQIKQASPDSLLKWGQKVLDCAALEEVFES